MAALDVATARRRGSAELRARSAIFIDVEMIILILSKVVDIRIFKITMFIVKFSIASMFRGDDARRVKTSSQIAA